MTKRVVVTNARVRIAISPRPQWRPVWFGNATREPGSLFADHVQHLDLNRKNLLSGRHSTQSRRKKSIRCPHAAGRAQPILGTMLPEMTAANGGHSRRSLV